MDRQDLTKTPGDLKNDSLLSEGRASVQGPKPLLVGIKYKNKKLPKIPEQTLLTSASGQSIARQERHPGQWHG